MLILYLYERRLYISRDTPTIDSLEEEWKSWANNIYQIRIWWSILREWRWNDVTSLYIYIYMREIASPSPSWDQWTKEKEEKFFLSLSARFVDDRKPYISFLFLRVADCERDVRAATNGNLRRQRVPGTSLHLFYKWTRAQGEGKTRGNKCQRDFMARSNDFSLPRTTPWNNELRFASPFGKQRRAHRLLPHRQFLFDSSLVFSGWGGEKKGGEGGKNDRCGHRWSTFLSVPYSSR